MIYIEVKATVGNVDEPFYISENERSFLEFFYRNGHRYELHRVYHLCKGKQTGQRIYTAEEMMGAHYMPSVYSVRVGA